MSTKTPIYSSFLLGILAVSLYLAYVVLYPFLHNIFLAIILATLFHPVNLRIRKFVGGRNTLAALLTAALITLGIILPCFFFLGALVSQAANSIDSLQNWIKTAHPENLLQSDTLSPYLNWIQDKLPFLQVDLDKLNIQNNLLALSRRTGQAMLDMGTKLLGNFIGLLMDFLIMLFVLFFLLRDGESMLAQLRGLSPLHPDQENRILQKMRDVARSVVMGSFLIAVCQGVAGGIGLAIVGIPALFWGSMMGFASLVPVVGTMVIWAPAATYLLVVGDWKGAAILAAWGVGIVSTIDSVLRPLLLQGKAQMSTFYVFLSIIGGIKYFGPLGILYGPMILSLAMVMLALYSEEYSDALKSKGGAPCAPMAGAIFRTEENRVDQNGKDS